MVRMILGKIKKKRLEYRRGKQGAEIAFGLVQKGLAAVPEQWSQGSIKGVGTHCRTGYSLGT